ncbi:MAG: hypothetical protein E7434_07575 [Ruminococcaceae bacterium]|nr:hypothetical protein [Oscillospiraceae bacterium]
MSASRERKKRVEYSTIAQPEVKKEKKKISEGWIFAICMILIAAVVFGGMWYYRYSQAHRTVLTVGDHDVEVCEFNFFYRELAATCDQYYSYLGMDNTIALDEQKIDSSDLSMMGLVGIDTSYLEAFEPVDGVYDVTWAQLLANNAMRNAASAYSVYQAGTAAGYKLTEEEQDSIDDSVAEIQSYADQNNMDIDDYIEAVFGRDCDEDAYRKYMEVVTVASSYPNTIEYTAEEMAARDAEAPEDFDTAAFYYYVTDASTIQAEQEAAEAATEEETSEENAEEEAVEEETEEETEAELTDEEKAELDNQAKEAAEKMAADFDVEDDSVSIYTDYTREYLESMSYSVELPEEAYDWLYGEAQPDEVKMFTIEKDEELEDDENRYAVVKFITREDYNTVNHLFLTIADDEEGAELAEGEKTAEEKVAEIKASLEADPSEENFRSLILANLDHEHEEGEEHDHSEEGNAENQSRYAFSSVSKEMYNWMMVEERAAGDWTVSDQEGQTVFYFYLGEGEGYRDLSIENTLRSEWYTETTDAAIENCGYDEEAAMTAEVKFY